MRKLLVGIVVLAAASMASAAGLTITGPVGVDLANLAPGATVDISVNVVGGVNVQGVTGFLMIEAPAAFSNVAAGSFWGGQINTPAIYSEDDVVDNAAGAVEPDGFSTAVITFTTAPDTVKITGSGSLYTAQLTVPNLENWTGTLKAELPGGFFTDLGDGVGLESPAIVVGTIPEPATALLLLAAVPFLRRRA
jgi:hypothetical protein